MTNNETDLMILEQLSKQISDLINKNSFENIAKIDEERKSIIKNFINKKSINSLTQNKVVTLIYENEKLISDAENKLRNLQKNKNKLDKRLKFYSANI